MFTTITDLRRKILLIGLLALLVCVTIPVMFASAAQQLTWESNYMRVHFDWNGSWDKTAYWAYGMWVFNIYDWSYLFGWYGLGWDKLSPLNTAPSAKLDFYFYNDPKDNAGGWSSGLTIKFNLAHMDSLDVSSHAWATQVLEFGTLVSHECSHSIFGAFVGTTRPDGTYSNWLTESWAYATGNCLWPWGAGDYDAGGWGPLYSWKDVKSNYRAYVNAPGSGGLLTMWGAGQVYSTKMQNQDNNFWNAWWTFHAVGYYLSVMDSNGVYNNAWFLTGLRSGKSISDSFYAVWQRTLNQNTTVHNNTMDFYYYFYNYMWL